MTIKCERGPTSIENTITELIFNICGLDKDETFCGHGFETLKGRIKLILNTYDSIDRAILQSLKDKGFLPMTTEICPEELIEAVSNAVGGPHSTGQFCADKVIDIVRNLLLEPVPGPKIRDVTIVNGPSHGQKLETVEGTGITLNMPATIRLWRYPEDADIRYAHPTYMDQYFIQGDFAYYIGQRITAGQFGMPHLDAEKPDLS